MAQVTRVSPISGDENTIELPITDEQLAGWESGAISYIQDAFPRLNASQRKFILTGITPTEWDKLFPEEDEGVGGTPI